METLNESIRRKKKQLRSYNTNTFYKRKEQLHKEYIEQLDKMLQEYPAYKTSQSNTYATQLSLLNGISKKIKALTDELLETVEKIERTISIGNDEIKVLEKVKYNLKQYTSFEDLDATSKQLLADSVSSYTNDRILFYLKLCVVLFIVVDIIKEKKALYSIIIILSTIVLSCLWLLYKYFTSSG